LRRPDSNLPPLIRDGEMHLYSEQRCKRKGKV